MFVKATKSRERVSEIDFSNDNFLTYFYIDIIKDIC